MKNKPLPAKQVALQIIRQLHRGGYQALLAGGCVRDMLLGKIPHDYDVATNAVPETITRLFPRTLTIGAQFGVVVVLAGGRQVEVATFRSDAEYPDGRRPQRVVFTDARHDAERRDFTINGMFYDPIAKQVIDYVGGQADLRNEIIRAIGDPSLRFAEDHLRMLRAIRFACRFNYQIDPDTWQAIRLHAPSLARISEERIAAEFEKILIDPHRLRGVQLTRDSGLLPLIFPGLEPAACEIGLQTLAHLPSRCSFPLALAAFLAACSTQQVHDFCRRLKTSNDLRQHTSWLVASYPKLLSAIPLSRGLLKKWLAEPLFEPLRQLLRCYLKGHNRSLTPLRRLQRQIRELGDEPISPPHLLDGHDLIHLGATPGPSLGQLVEELYLAQLENQVKTRSQAEAWSRRWLIQHQKT